jgi:formylmethanofuran dehydrogenase subunit E
LETARIGEVEEEFGHAPESDPTRPTAPCARCGEWRVFVIRDAENSPSRFVCIDCRALLTLALTDIAPG